MANSKFSYVRSFEQDDSLPKGNWIVLSLSNITKGLPQHILSDSTSRESFQKLMKFSTKEVMHHFKDITLAFCHFNTIHLVIKKDCTVYKRRSFKLCTYMVSCVTAYFVSNWHKYFECKKDAATFEGKVFMFPSNQLLRGYLTHKQNLHHNLNLMHTLYAAERKTTQSVVDLDEFMKMHEKKMDKYFNETLFSNYGINYNNEPIENKKGIILQGKKDFASPDLKNNDFWNNYLVDEIPTSFDSKLKKFSEFEVKHHIVPDSWIVVRIDGKGFHKLSKDHGFQKPNDLGAINLMNHCASHVMKLNPEIAMAFGESDEYSFVVQRHRKLTPKSQMTLVSLVVSQFTSAYVSNWSDFIGCKLKSLPMFDGRAVMYAQNSTLRDYLSWRQADCHINNMYNTVFWRLIQLKGMSNDEATKHLEGTFAVDKRRILSDLGNDYDDEPAIHKKGSFLYRKSSEILPISDRFSLYSYFLSTLHNFVPSLFNKHQAILPAKLSEDKKSDCIVLTHEDIIGDEFWKRNSHLLGSEKKTMKVTFE